VLSSVVTYKVMIPLHAGVPTATIEAWLETAATSLSSTAFGAAYVQACILWAASHIEPNVAMGLYTPGASICEPVAPPEGVKFLAPQDTAYWRAFLSIRNSRVATAPFFVSGLPRCVR
jgi:hypothetical protein